VLYIHGSEPARFFFFSFFFARGTRSASDREARFDIDGARGGRMYIAYAR
jgi:hypothetical protein